MVKLRVGLVGCGTISEIYLTNSKRFENFDIVVCADQATERASAKAAKHGIPRISTVEQLMNDPEVDLVLNLTTPQSHAAIDIAALEAGKSVYSEKPLAIDLIDGQRIIDTASTKGLIVGCAPDTFLGGRLQTVRKLLDEGAIGFPVGAFVAMACHGHESWHPAPEFYYKRGAGPMFDMAPYYLTALVSVLGPVERVNGAARKPFEERTIESKPLKGSKIEVEVPTHVCGTMTFSSGPIASFVMSFDVWDSYLPRLEIYGSEGTIAIPDPDPLAGPNLFGGEISLRRREQADWNGDAAVLPRRRARSDWEIVQPAFPYCGDARGVGLADMVAARQLGRKARASGELAYHVLEIIHGVLESSKTAEVYQLKSTCDLPLPFSTQTREFSFTE